MAVSLEGKIKGINLTNFLQIVQLEKPNCTLVVSKNDKEGYLYIEEGEVIDADIKNGMKNLDAAFEILSWDDPSIELKKTLDKNQKKINMPLMNLLMEAARFKDEREEDGSVTQEEDQEEDLFPDEDQYLDDLDSVSLELDDTTSYIEQDIPKEVLLEEIDLLENENESEVDKYDLGAEIENKSIVDDFTENIVLTPKQEISPFAKQQEEFQTHSIEDYIEKKSYKKVILLSLLIISISAAGLFFGLTYFKNETINNEYAKLQQNIEKMLYEEQKVSLLKKFIKLYPDHPLGQKASQQLNQIVNRSQKDSYAILSANIKALKIDDLYEKRASKYYDNFIARYVKGPYVDKAIQDKNSIPSVIRDYKFSQLKQMPDSDISQKLKAITLFQKNYPLAYSQEVQKIKNKLGSYYLSNLNSNLSDCNTLEKYKDCMDNVEIFIKIFPEHPDLYIANKIQKDLEENYWTTALLNSAKNNTKSIEEEKQFLKDYIKSHNQYSITVAVQSRIREIDEILNEQTKFDKIVEYAQNPDYPLNNRINRVQVYIYSDIPDTYKAKAQKELNRLQQQKDKLMASAALQKKQQELLEQQTSQAQNKEVDINELIEKAFPKAAEISQKLKKSERFLPYKNFSFKDKLTGKTWMILDFDDFSKEQCTNYKKALELTTKINIDGYSDWRLPTQQELLTLFKNKPFFPIEKQKWFWSSTVFEKGFNTYSAAVSDKNNQERETLDKNILEECGTFKLIRP